MVNFSPAAPKYNCKKNGRWRMNKVLPIIIVCSVGLALCLAYIVWLCVKSLRTNPHVKRKREFEIEDDVLTIRLGKRKKSKK